MPTDGTVVGNANRGTEELGGVTLGDSNVNSTVTSLALVTNVPSLGSIPQPPLLFIRGKIYVIK